MKRLIHYIILLMVSAGAQAQLIVNSNGQTGMGIAPNIGYALSAYSTDKGLRSESFATASESTSTGVAGHAGIPYHGLAIGVKGVSNAANGVIAGTSYGVYGDATGSYSGENYGVFGHISPHIEGAGVYGFAYSSLMYTTLPTRYAGYFNGDLGITSDLVMESLQLSNTVTLHSIGELSAQRGNILQQLQRLSIVGYTYRSEHNASNLSYTAKQAISKQHYGLDADQLAEVFPDLVYDNTDGTKSINYIEMIPILVQAVGELKEDIDKLK